jgi:isopentenyl-diphosphate delta-isomerase
MSLIPAWNAGALAPVDKLEVHRRGLRHPAISVFVMRGNTVLLQRRAASKYHCAGLWGNTVCTHPHWGEEMADAARRRLREELGIEGLSLRPAAVVEYRAEVGGGMIEHEVVDVFLADAPDDLVVVPNPEEVAEIRWADLWDLRAEAFRHPDRFAPWLRIYLSDHMDRIFGVLNRA